MPNCPICGAGVSSSKIEFRGRKTFECPECKAKLKLSSSVYIVFYSTLLFATITTVILETLPNTQLRTGMGLLLGVIGFFGPFALIFLAPTMYWLAKAPLVIVEQRPRCSHCNTIITQPNPEFCPGCGERLSIEDLKGIPPRRITHKKS